MEKIVNYNKNDPYYLPTLHDLGISKDLKFVGVGAEYEYTALSITTPYPNTNTVHTEHYWKKGIIGTPFGILIRDIEHYLETGRIRRIKNNTDVYVKVNEEYGYDNCIQKGIHIMPYWEYSIDRAVGDKLRMTERVEYIDIVDKRITKMKLFYYEISRIQINDAKDGLPIFTSDFGKSNDIAVSSVRSNPRYLVIEANNSRDGYKKLLEKFCINNPDKSDLFNKISLLHGIMTINNETAYRFTSGGRQVESVNKHLGDQIHVITSNPYLMVLYENDVMIVEEDEVKRAMIKKELLKPTDKFLSKMEDAQKLNETKMAKKQKETIRGVHVFIEDIEPIKEEKKQPKERISVTKWKNRIKPNLKAFSNIHEKVSTIKVGGVWKTIRKKSKDYFRKFFQTWSKTKTISITKKLALPEHTSVVLTPDRIWGFNKKGEYIPFPISKEKLQKSTERLVFIASKISNEVKRIPHIEALALVDTKEWKFISKKEGKRLWNDTYQMNYEEGKYIKGVIGTDKDGNPILKAKKGRSFLPSKDDRLKFHNIRPRKIKSTKVTAPDKSYHTLDGEYQPSRLKKTYTISSNKIKTFIPNKDGSDHLYVENGRHPNRISKHTGTHNHVSKDRLNEYQVTLTTKLQSGSEEDIYTILAPNEQKAISRSTKKKRQEIVKQSGLAIKPKQVKNKIVAKEVIITKPGKVKPVVTIQNIEHVPEVLTRLDSIDKFEKDKDGVMQKIGTEPVTVTTYKTKRMDNPGKREQKLPGDQLSKGQRKRLKKKKHWELPMSSERIIDTPPF